MAGIKVFASLEEARAAGFFPFERMADGFLVRRDLGDKLALAIVKIKKPEPQPEPDVAEKL